MWRPPENQNAQTKHKRSAHSGHSNMQDSIRQLYTTQAHNTATLTVCRTYARKSIAKRVTSLLNRVEVFRKRTRVAHELVTFSMGKFACVPSDVRMRFVCLCMCVQVRYAYIAHKRETLFQIITCTTNQHTRICMVCNRTQRSSSLCCLHMNIHTHSNPTKLHTTHIPVPIEANS